MTKLKLDDWEERCKRFVVSHLDNLSKVAAAGFASRGRGAVVIWTSDLTGGEALTHEGETLRYWYVERAEITGWEALALSPNWSTATYLPASSSLLSCPTLDVSSAVAGWLSQTTTESEGGRAKTPKSLACDRKEYEDSEN